MTTHACVYELQSNQGPATVGINPRMVVTGEANGIPGSGTAPNGTATWTTGPLPFPFYIPPSGYDTDEGDTYVRKVIGCMGGAVATPPLIVGFGFDDSETLPATPFWSVNGGCHDNGTDQPIQPFVFPSQGRQAPPNILVFRDFAAIALWGFTGGPEDADLHVEYGYPIANPYMGLSHFCEFQEQPPDSAAEGRGKLTELLNGIQNGVGRFQLGTNAVGSPVFANGCNFAGVAPEGAVYITSADFGSPDPDGIPDQFQQNTASRFRFHPSVFLRRGQYVRGLARQYQDPEAINTAGSLGQVFNVIVQNETIDRSQWLIVIDGQPQLVELLHPTGSDLYRPRDIWNQIWVPLIQGSNATANAVGFRRPFGPSSFGPDSEEITVLSNRLAFLEYARCLPLPGLPVTQLQTAPPNGGGGDP